MDMESDIGDSEADMPGIFRLMMIIPPSLNCISMEIEGGRKERSRKQ